jgi:hypothetical protein
MGVLAPGTVLGGCRIEAVVGRGGMGVVYRARQLDLDRDVALKVIAPELLLDAETRDRFLSEARAAGAVEHPNVVPVHRAGLEEGRAYLVMRYVAGDDLRMLVRREGPLSPAAAAMVALQLGDALDAIHRAGYVHRDVKPHNVMVDADGHAYLSDFGLAKHALSSGPTRSEQWVGTLDYVAPEQIRGGPVDARADVYALGGVIYFMVTGHVPFERDADHAKLWAHLHDEPRPPSTVLPGLPEELDAVVLRALAKEPERRQPSAGDLARAANAAAGGRAAPASERSVARGAAASGVTEIARTAPQPPSARRPRRAVAAVALAVLAAVAASAFLVLRDGDRTPIANIGPTPTPTRRTTAPAKRKGPSVGETIGSFGREPRGAAVADGTVWVISNSLDHATLLDARTMDRGAHPQIGYGASDIAVDGNTVWVAFKSTSTLRAFDARTHEKIHDVSVPFPPTRIAVGPSGLWAIGRTDPEDDPDYLMHRDQDGARLDEQAIEFGASAIALGGDDLFLALERKNQVVRVQPDGTLERAAWLANSVTDLAYGAGYLWATVAEDDIVARIDLDRRRAIKGIACGRPAQIAVAHGRVFVTCYLDNRVVMIDPARPERRKPPWVRTPANPLGIAAGAGHVWVTGTGRDTLTRIDF